MGGRKRLSPERAMERRSLQSKSVTPARQKGASGATVGGAGNAKRPPKGK